MSYVDTSCCEAAHGCSIPCARPGSAGCFPYPVQGDHCASRTPSALTSNEKYILPLSPVYYRGITPMMRYPGCDSELVCHPESVKAYQTVPTSCNCDQVTVPPQKTACKSCKSF